MSTPLTAQSATITTAAIEIQTLTLGRKQVTLAVFRQMPEGDWLDRSATPQGLAWGTVNYHADRCEGLPEHQHVVWQDGAVLRRCRMPRSPLQALGWEGRQLWAEEFDDLIRATWCRHGHPTWYREGPIDGWLSIDSRTTSASFILAGQECGGSLPEALRYRQRTGSMPDDHECHEVDDDSYGQLRKDASGVVAEHEEWCVRYRFHYANAGPQLFIAV